MQHVKELAEKRLVLATKFASEVAKLQKEREPSAETDEQALLYAHMLKQYCCQHHCGKCIFAFYAKTGKNPCSFQATRSQPYSWLRSEPRREPRIPPDVRARIIQTFCKSR